MCGVRYDEMIERGIISKSMQYLLLSGDEASRLRLPSVDTCTMSDKLRLSLRVHGYDWGTNI